MIRRTNGKRRAVPPKYIERPGKTVKISLLAKEKVEFTGHALEQMKIRNITEREVIETIKRPTRTNLRTQPHRHRVRKNKSTYKAIDIVYELLADRVRIVTAIAITLARPPIKRRPRHKR